MSSRSNTYEGISPGIEQQVKHLAQGINPIGVSGENSVLDPRSENFSSKAWTKNMAEIAQSDPEYYKPFSIGCCWKHL